MNFKRSVRYRIISKERLHDPTITPVLNSATETPNFLNVSPVCNLLLKCFESRSSEDPKPPR